MITETRSS